MQQEEFSLHCSYLESFSKIKMFVGAQWMNKNLTGEDGEGALPLILVPTPGVGMENKQAQ